MVGRGTVKINMFNDVVMILTDVQYVVGLEKNHI